MDFSYFPAWVYIGLAIVSLLLGQAIRRYLRHRKIRQAEMWKQKTREIKKQLKRNKKLAKKEAKKTNAKNPPL